MCSRWKTQFHVNTVFVNKAWHKKILQLMCSVSPMWISRGDPFWEIFLDIDLKISASAKTQWLKHSANIVDADKVINVELHNWTFINLIFYSWQKYFLSITKTFLVSVIQKGIFLFKSLFLELIVASFSLGYEENIFSLTYSLICKNKNWLFLLYVYETIVLSSLENSINIFGLKNAFIVFRRWNDCSFLSVLCPVLKSKRKWLWLVHLFTIW